MKKLFENFLESDNFLDYIDYYEMISNNKKYAPNQNEDNPKMYSTIQYFLELSQICSISNFDMNQLTNIYIQTVPVIVPKVIIKLVMNDKSDDESLKSDLSDKGPQINWSTKYLNYDILESDDDDYITNNYKQHISIHGLIKTIEIKKRILKTTTYDSYEEDNDYSDENDLIENDFSDNEYFD